MEVCFVIKNSFLGGSFMGISTGMPACMHGCMHGCIDACMHACMHMWVNKSIWHTDLAQVNKFILWPARAVLIKPVLMK